MKFTDFILFLFLWISGLATHYVLQGEVNGFALITSLIIASFTTIMFPIRDERP